METFCAGHIESRNKIYMAIKDGPPVVLHEDPRPEAALNMKTQKARLNETANDFYTTYFLQAKLRCEAQTQPGVPLCLG